MSSSETDEWVAVRQAYGKLFNENASLTGRLEEAESKLAEFGVQWDGEKYSFDGKG